MFYNFLAKICIIYLQFTQISVKLDIFMQKLKKFLQKLNENLSKTQGFFQKLKLPELLGPVMFQSGVQKKSLWYFSEEVVCAKTFWNT